MADQCPKLRDDLVLKRQVMAGEVTYLIKNRETSEYLRFHEMEWAIISRLNGETSYQEIADAFAEQFADVDMDAGQIEDFVDSLKKKELIVRSAAERSIVRLVVHRTVAMSIDSRPPRRRLVDDTGRG